MVLSRVTVLVSPCYGVNLCDVLKICISKSPVDTVRGTETLSEFHFSRELFVISTPHLVKVICDFCKDTSELYMVFL